MKCKLHQGVKDFFFSLFVGAAVLPILLLSVVVLLAGVSYMIGTTVYEVYPELLAIGTHGDIYVYSTLPQYLLHVGCNLLGLALIGIGLSLLALGLLYLAYSETKDSYRYRKYRLEYSTNSPQPAWKVLISYVVECDQTKDVK